MRSAAKQPVTPLSAAPRGRRLALVVLAGAVLLSMTTWFSASAVIPQLRLEWGLTTATSSWLTVAVQVGFVAGALVSAVANLADRVNPRHIFLWSSLGAAMANAGLVLAGSLWSAIALRLATGFFLAGVYPPAIKLVSTWFRRGRGLALGVMVGALTLGSAAPQLINGLGGLDWQAVVLWTSALTVLGGLLIGGVLEDGPFPFPPARFDPGYALRVFRNRGVRLANFGYFGHMWELYSVWTWFGLFFSASLSRAAYRGDLRLMAGVATFLVIGAGALGAGVAGALADRFGRSLVAAGALIVSGTCSLTIGLLFDRPVLVFLAGLVWGFAVVADSAQFSTIVTEVCEQEYVGTASTVQLALGFLLTTITIRLVPTLESAVGWRMAFAVLALGPALGVVAMLRLWRAPEAALIAGGNG
jgi:MFS family permease